MSSSQTPPCCGADACDRASAETCDAMEDYHERQRVRLRARGWTWALDEQIAARRAVDGRDAREMRGERPDMSGWLLF